MLTHLDCLSLPSDECLEAVDYYFVAQHPVKFVLICIYVYRNYQVNMHGIIYQSLNTVRGYYGFVDKCHTFITFWTFDFSHLHTDSPSFFNDGIIPHIFADIMNLFRYFD